MNHTINKERSGYFDLIKTLAIMLVLNAHFVDRFCDYYFRIFPFSYMFHCLSAKFGVSVFAVVSGYFAYVSGKKNGETIAYVIKRYLSFATACFISNNIVYLLNMNGIREATSYGMVVGESIILSNYFCSSFWFIRDYFLGCVVSFLIGRFDISNNDVFIIILLCLIGRKFLLPTVILGAPLNRISLKESAYLKNKYAMIIAVIIFFSPVFINRGYDGITQIIDAVRSFILIYYLKDVHGFRRIYESRIIRQIGVMTFSLLTVHHIFMDAFDRYFISSFNSVSLIYLLWLITCLFTAVPLNYLIRVTDKAVFSLVNKTFMMACHLTKNE